ncbi:hypothetical protein GTA51_18610 [Desulfovibrio aerotolerans]|uniref:Uncharacterized protein n=1 Tax=Solidesulfovibrio aerotolerans TaxID=295255 RepID=A0A7C9IN61_9BACT|nr:hypothetical protein [Solidesulfovibrio aerotolerans]MYL85121.1 hypothetical protein [Solidesulfovibrio aerotolerans]
MEKNKLDMMYDVLGRRIIALQDKLCDLPAGDEKRMVIIYILAELDDLKKEFSKIL